MLFFWYQVDVVLTFRSAVYFEDKDLRCYLCLAVLASVVDVEK
jgi:hypothetical protein